jgi:acyl-CoA synthetase (AMP-forming)/AMP-acid ligase II
MGGQTRSYADVQRQSWRVGRALDRAGIRPGDKVAILSGNDPVAFGCVFGISRAGAVWCPVNPRNEAAENRELLDLFDCRCLIFAPAFAPLVAKIAPALPKLVSLVCLGEPADVPGAVAFADWLAGLSEEPWQADPVDDVVMIAGTGGTTGTPKGVMLTGRNIETMAALTLMSYPFDPGRSTWPWPRSPTRQACCASRSWPWAARSSSCRRLTWGSSSPLPSGTG